MSRTNEILSDAPTKPKRSRGKGIAAATIAVTTIVVSSAFVSSRFLSGSPSEPTVGAQVVSANAIAPTKSIEDVWPQAAHEMPTVLPNGGVVRPQAFLDDNTVLITAESKFERADGILAYDLNNGKTRKISDIPTPEGASIFASGFAVGYGRIGWWTARKKDGKEIADIWSAPVSGGKPTIVTSFSLPPRSPEGLITALTVLRDGFAWSTGNLGVFKVPFSGGDPQAVAGTQGQHIFQWPWVGSPNPRNRRNIPYQSMLNAESGERRASGAMDNAQLVACGITRCVGKQGDAAPAKVHGRDGREIGEIPLPFVAPQPIRLDRFLTGDGPGWSWSALYDLQTGTAVDLRTDRSGRRYLPTSDLRLLVMPRDDKFLIVNLAAIA
ncbi:hypothetical protein OHA25_40180 [Nonomuraea sp. NBC_00507]|uniref:hypothetical protein n=1 Tax=Nonomuraea sp. NBC_00507 TaxID=2976002 RepID=UPI002E16C8B9